MKNSLIILFAAVALLQGCTADSNETTMTNSASTPYALVIHGGAGAITRARAC